MKILAPFWVSHECQTYDYLNIHYDQDTAAKSTAYLIKIRPPGLCYEYLVPCALSTEDALGKFNQHIQRLIAVAAVLLNDPNEPITLLTFPDAFDATWKRQVEETTQELETVSESFEEVAEELCDAILAGDTAQVYLLQEHRQLMMDRCNVLKEKLTTLRSSPKKSDSGTALELMCSKQFEILRAIDAGSYSIEQLENNRVIPVAYFDDSRGDLSSTTHFGSDEVSLMEEKLPHLQLAPLTLRSTSLNVDLCQNWLRFNCPTQFYYSYGYYGCTCKSARRLSQLS